VRLCASRAGAAHGGRHPRDDRSSGQPAWSASGHFASSLEELREIGSAIRIAALPGPFKRRLGTAEIPALCENDTETTRRRGVAVRVRYP
jgi:hypothetical protein